jgi:hypothetical protein
MKCDICSKKVEETFLKKIVGTYMRNEKRKKKIVCNACQKQYTQEELLTKL